MRRLPHSGLTYHACGVALLFALSTALPSLAVSPEVMNAFQAVGNGTATASQKALAFAHNHDLQTLAGQGATLRLPNGELSHVPNPDHISKEVFQANQRTYSELMDQRFAELADECGLDYELRASKEPKVGTDTDANIRARQGTGKMTKARWARAQAEFNAKVRSFLKANGVPVRGNENWARRLDVDLMPDPAHTDPDVFEEIAAELNKQGGVMYENMKTVSAQFKIDKGVAISVTEHQSYVEEMQDLAQQHQTKAEKLDAQARKVAKTNPREARKLSAKAQIAKTKAGKYHARVDQANSSLEKNYGAKPAGDTPEPQSKKRGLDRSIEEAGTYRGPESARQAAEIAAHKRYLETRSARRACEALERVAQSDPSKLPQCRKAIAQHARRLTMSQQGELIETLRIQGKDGGKLAREVAAEMRANRAKSRAPTQAPPSRIVKHGGKALMIYGLYQGYKRATDEIANDTDSRYGEVYAVGKGTVLTLWHGFGFSHAWETGTQAGKDAHREYQEHVRAGRIDPNSWFYWGGMKGWAVLSGLGRGLKSMTVDAAWHTGKQLREAAMELKGSYVGADGKSLSSYKEMEKQLEHELYMRFRVLGASDVGARRAAQELKRGNRTYAKELLAVLAAKKAKGEGPVWEKEAQRWKRTGTKPALPVTPPPEKKPAVPERSFWDDLIGVRDAAAAKIDAARQAAGAAWEEASYQGPRNDSGQRVDADDYEDGDMIMTKDGTEFVRHNGEWKTFTRDKDGKLDVEGVGKKTLEELKPKQDPVAGPDPRDQTPEAKPVVPVADGEPTFVPWTSHQTHSYYSAAIWQAHEHGAIRAFNADPQGEQRGKTPPPPTPAYDPVTACKQPTGQAGTADKRVKWLDEHYPKWRKIVLVAFEKGWQDCWNNTYGNGAPGIKDLDPDFYAGADLANGPGLDFQLLSPADGRLAVGESARFRAARGVQSMSERDDAARYKFLYQPHPEVTFSPFEDDDEPPCETTATFTRPGRVSVWVELLNVAGGTAKTVQRSEVITIQVGPPTFDVVVSPSNPDVGADVTATVKLLAEAKDIDFRWELAGKAKVLGASGDSRRITFRCADTEPVTVIARGYTRGHGDDLGEARVRVMAGAPGATDDTRTSQQEKDRADAEKKAQELVNEGIRLEGTGNLEGALAKYEEALRINPGPDVEARIQAVRKRIEEAQRGEVARQLIDEGYRLETGGDFAGAIAKYEASIALVPNEGVRKHIDELTRQLGSERDRTALIAEGDALARAADYDGAVVKYKAAQRIRDDDDVRTRVEAALRKGEAERRASDLVKQGYQQESAGDFAAAVRLYGEAQALVQRPGVSARIETVRKAMDVISQGTGQEAAGKLPEALQLYDAAYALVRSASIAQRIEKTRRDIAERERHRTAVLAEGDTLARGGDYDGAVAKYEAAQRVRDDNDVRARIQAAQRKSRELHEEWMALLNRGHAHEEKTEWDKAATCYGRAQELRADARVGERLADVRRKAREQQEAQAKEAQRQAAIKREAQERDVARQKEAAQRAAEEAHRKAEQQAARPRTKLSGTYRGRDPDGITITLEVMQRNDQITVDMSVSGFSGRIPRQNGTLRGDTFAVKFGDETLTFRFTDGGKTLNMRTPDGTIALRRQ